MDELKPCPFCGMWNKRPIDDALLARITKLEAALAAAREDSERLDWLFRPNGDCAAWLWDDAIELAAVDDNAPFEDEQMGPWLRKAIDAARKDTK